MRKRVFVLLSMLLLGSAGIAAAQSQPSAEVRRIVSKTIPSYPEIAKKMNLSGTVKVLATVAPDGSVKAVQPMGGSPLLIQAAQDAVNKWRFAPGNAETKEVIELHFSPQ